MNKKGRFIKNGVFSLEYDKETLKDMVLEMQSRINMNIEKLIARKKVEQAKLKVADKENNLMLCLVIGETINEIDNLIREYATEEQIIELHKKGLI